MTKTKVKKSDKGDLNAPVEETPVQTKRTKAPVLVISDENIMYALVKAGGIAKSGQLRDNIDKGNYPSISSPALGTAIRNRALEMANVGKIEAVHVDGKRTWVFKTKE